MFQSNNNSLINGYGTTIGSQFALLTGNPGFGAAMFKNIDNMPSGTYNLTHGRALGAIYLDVAALVILL
jgi:hypothetical protein